MHCIDVDHPGLGKVRRVYGFSAGEADRRARAQKRLWETQWQRRRDLRARLEGDNSLLIAFKKALADEASDEAAGEIASLRSILANALDAKIIPDWNTA